MKYSTYKLQNGDYVKKQNENEFESVDYIEEVVQAVTLALKTKKNNFYPDKNFGSNIQKIIDSKNEEQVLVYARQATDCIDGVYVKNAVIQNNSLFADLIINDIERGVCVSFETDL